MIFLTLVCVAARPASQDRSRRQRNLLQAWASSFQKTLQVLSGPPLGLLLSNTRPLFTPLFFGRLHFQPQNSAWDSCQACRRCSAMHIQPSECCQSGLLSNFGSNPIAKGLYNAVINMFTLQTADTPLSRGPYWFLCLDTEPPLVVGCTLHNYMCLPGILCIPGSRQGATARRLHFIAQSPVFIKSHGSKHTIQPLHANVNVVHWSLWCSHEHTT